MLLEGTFGMKFHKQISTQHSVHKTVFCSYLDFHRVRIKFKIRKYWEKREMWLFFIIPHANVQCCDHFLCRLQSSMCVLRLRLRLCGYQCSRLQPPTSGTRRFYSSLITTKHWCYHKNTMSLYKNVLNKLVLSSI